MEVIVDFRGVDIVVHGSYIKGEDSVYNYGDGNGYPGSASDFEIDKITVIDSSVDIFDFLSSRDLEVITDSVINIIKN